MEKYFHLISKVSYFLALELRYFSKYDFKFPILKSTCLFLLISIQKDRFLELCSMRLVQLVWIHQAIWFTHLSKWLLICLHSLETYFWIVLAFQKHLCLDSQVKYCSVHLMFRFCLDLSYLLIALFLGPYLFDFIDRSFQAYLL